MVEAEWLAHCIYEYANKRICSVRFENCENTLTLHTYATCLFCKLPLAAEPTVTLMRHQPIALLNTEVLVTNSINRLTGDVTKIVRLSADWCTKYTKKSFTFLASNATYLSKVHHIHTHTIFSSVLC